MADDARDESLGVLLEVEPLDEITRRRLVSTALGTTAPDRRLRWIAAAAIVVVLVGGLVVLVASGGNDDRQAATPALSPAHPSSGAAEPGAQSKDVSPSPAPEAAAGSVTNGSSGAAAPGTPVDVGDFGDLDRAANLEHLRRALTPSAVADRSAATTAAPSRGAQLAAELAARACLDALPRGTITAVATGTIDGRRAVVVETTTEDGTRSIDAAVGDPCTVRPLS
jgi:hypothetical protein